MPVRIPSTLPAVEELKNENIFVKIKNMIIRFFRKFGKNKE